MKVLRVQSITALKALRETWKSEHCSLGFVPTMGALHEGHLQLVRKAQSTTDRVVVSIFVNKLQFNNASDFDLYPRNIQADMDMLAELNVDAVFTPSHEDIYGQGEVQHYNLGELESTMEGSFRPGHFQGVAEVVNRLFQAVEPDFAFFGEKDFQQVQVIRRMSEITQFSGEIVVVPTQRDSNGLALSSRNQRLSQACLVQTAPVIFKTLSDTAVRMQSKSWTVDALKQKAQTHLNEAGLVPEYFEICSSKSITPIPGSDIPKQGDFRIFIAVPVEGVRLIDNLGLKL